MPSRGPVPLLALLLAVVLAPVAQAAQLPPGGTFADDDGNIHEGFIEAIAAEGITQGCATGTPRYCPERPVTRAEMAAFLVRALGEDGNLPPYRGYFADVPAGQWYTGYVERLYELEVTEGCATQPLRYCPGEPVKRDQMASFIGRAWQLQPMMPPPRPPVVLQEVVGGLASPTLVTAPPGDPRLFIVERAGLIRVLDGGRLGTFLDISDRVGSSGSEQGLLGLAFHRDYLANGLFYVNYTNTSGDTVVEEYRVSGDPNRADRAARLLLLVDQPFANHNGGNIAFGPDGLLYVGMGDGGGAGDPFGNAQDPSSRLGKLLRVNVGNGVQDVWASGLRNPWRFSFDPPTGRLYIADVGQGSWEEVNVVDASVAGLDYGWDLCEGAHDYPGTASPCAASGTVLPVLEYSHAECGPCSVIGGFVYRGSALPHLQGTYFYADLSGWVRSFRFEGGAVTDRRDWRDSFGSIGFIQSFGLDGSGELYVATAGGTIYRLAYGS
ncbi:MAG: PQQ-dependent sugar dehydrogenase [Actinomycetota bacterium]|nr:PQQ-dependent sugar dehydrogenase [Actinomycetota bacterium]